MQLIKQLYIKERRIQAQEHEEARRHKEHKRRVPQRLPVNQRALTARGRHARPHEGDRHGRDAEQDEGDHARGPPKADTADEAAENDGEDDARERAAGAGDADGERPARAEVLREDGRRRQEHQAHAHADAHALREQDVPVRRPERRHEHAEHEQELAREEQVPEVACVVEGACHHADEHEEAGLQGADPGDGRRRLGREQVGFVVRLEYPEAVHQAPGSHERRP